jgi:hypothetical protein
MLFGLIQNLVAQSPWCPAAYDYNQYYSSTNYLSALEQVRVRSGNNVLINKPADGWNYTGSCGSEFVLVNSPSNAINITAGNTYTIDASASATYNYAGNFGAYIDYNNDKDFLDNGEFLGQWAYNVPGGNTVSQLYSRNFTVPCNISPSATRLRVMAQYYYTYSQATGCATCNSYRLYYGETADFSINLVLPSSVNANFIAPTEAWVKTVVTFINNNQVGYTQHAWDVNNDGSFEQRGITPDYKTTSGATGTWTTPGTKCVKLRSTNCLGRDSIVKCLTLKAPTATPIIDFVAERTTIEQYESVKIFDLSENGPYEWTWDVYDSTTYATSDYYPNLADGDLYSDPWGTGADEFSQNPEKLLV